MQKFLTSFLIIFYFSQIALSQAITKHIVIDQFGYRPQDQKIAIIRNPQVGYDSNENFTPGNTYQLVDATTKESVFEGIITFQFSGKDDKQYGDDVWYFDFSSFQDDGQFYILDVENNVRSYAFRIADDVYNSVLADAVRMLFYQRAGHEKKSKFAGEAWCDAASHIGNLQDKNCRLYSAKNDASTEKDVHGGWYDAGDCNKYTTWGCNYVEILLKAYRENPSVWTDDYNIPESGNGIPDLLDEVKWELDWILRMQQDDGGVLCIVNLDAASPPSAFTGQTFYGPATTNASYATAKACAAGYLVYKNFLPSYAETLKKSAVAAWEWAEANQSVEFYNTQNNVAAGEQEGGSDDRLGLRLNAALYLYEMTEEKTYLTVFESNYKNLDFVKWSWYMDQYRHQDQDMILRYISMENVSTSIQAELRKGLQKGFTASGRFADMLGKDAYRSYITHYNWGSNSHKSTCGNLFYSFAQKDLIDDEDTYISAAEDYIHYIHGVNPFAMVYLTNMNEHGASNSVNQMYHSWFCHGSSLWDDVQSSMYGPAPGYLIGGPYAYESGDNRTSYSWADCCDAQSCGSEYNNSLCNKDYLFSDNEPYAKCYNDFNEGWPVNSWQITEPSCGYQVNYIRLLSKFASAETTTAITENNKPIINIYPNPTSDDIYIETENTELKYVSLFDLQSREILSIKTESSIVTLNIASIPEGIYILQIFNEGNIISKKIEKTR